ncbi:MAG: bifunctional nuclease family protein [Nitrospiraceae bacterium]|nr:bifunctional nuclease family protein [Nitrospiraceae bacterium]
MRGGTMKQLILALSIGMVIGGALVSSAAETPKVKIEHVEVRLTDRGHVVLLKAEQKVIPVFVDPTVALSIHGALTGEKTPRPLSHDLMHTILTAMSAKVTQVVITLHDGTYFGALSVTTKDITKVFDSRSSDAIALAIHFKAPILVGRDLLDSAGISMKEQGGAETL